ncbi:DUF736 family protein [Caulobacter sp. UNC358MFTsu5.1]|uniref:DUF736 domain-containing protein n=1 Tax=Caulobacter sp. UNC358MFTsu5.1 TaxID=1449049 RepID=UPI0004A70967|nr:DUF736 family protein [Caulobacter sp. UNC358MFTsu5.1]
MSRLIIGAFRLAKDGGWEGEIRSLLMNLKVRFAPNDDRTGPNAPAFHVMTGAVRLGEAWEARWRAQRDRTFYRVSLDDPFLPGPLSAALFPREDGEAAQLVWTRPNPERRDSAEPVENSDVVS